MRVTQGLLQVNDLQHCHVENVQSATVALQCFDPCDPVLYGQPEHGL